MLDEKISSCINDISAIFGGLEDLDRQLSIISTDEIFTEELCDMLQKLVILLSQSPGIAELILPHLGEMQKQNNISLLETITVDNVEKTCSSVNSLYDKIGVMWERICYYLEKYSLSFVLDNYVPLASLHNHFNLCLLKNHVVNLQHMFVPKLVWERYKDYRFHYFESYSCLCPVSGSCFGCCLRLCIQCLYEDEFLTYIGCFHPFIVTQSNIMEIYIDVINKKFHRLLNLLDECMGKKKDFTEEIISILHTSHLSHDKHAKTCFKCFMQNKIDSEMEAALYCVQSNYGTESVWKSVFLSSVIKVTEAILIFEDKINILFHKKETMYHAHMDELSVLLEGSKLILATESPEQSPFSRPQSKKNLEKHVSLMEGEKIFFLWNWRRNIVERGYLSYLQRSLQNDVESIVKVLIEKEKIILKHQQWRDLLISDKTIQFESESVKTATLLQSTFSTVKTLEKYLPVLHTSCDSFLSFKSSFYHTLESYVINLVQHLKEIAGRTDDTCIIFYEYIAINNAAFLKDKLQGYCEILKGSVCESQNNICHSLSQLMDELIESAVLRHFKYVSCSILFDADSYNFVDSKPFFEGERVSYSIQMWNLYMEGLIHDMNFFLPQNCAQKLYVKVLSSSLEHFLIRYSSATPSEFRTPQVMCDLYALLLCSSELLWPACTSAFEYMGRKQEMAENAISSCINKIHSSCCFLLTVLVVLSAPINEIFKIFKTGFPQPRLSVRTKYESVSPWLPWIRCEMFSEFYQRQIVSNVSVWLSVKACTSWNLPNPSTVIHAFTDHNCTLSILLMMQAACSSLSLHKDSHTTSEAAKVKLAYSLLRLLICYDNHIHLQDILLPVIEKTNGWQEFDSASVNKPLYERSWWYRGLVKTLRPYLVGVFEEVIPFWLDISKKCNDPTTIKSFNTLKSSLKNHVVCVCEKDPLNSMKDEFEPTDEIISFVCLRKILESMLRNIILLPQALKLFFLSLDLHISNYVPEIHSVHQSLPLQILVSCVIDFLRNEKFISGIMDNIRKMAILTTNALETLFCEKDFIFLNENYTKLVTILLSSIHAKFKDLRKELDKASDTVHIQDIRDEILEITVHQLLQLPGGNDTILYLHQILKQNEKWIQKSLGVPGMLSSDMVNNPLSPSPLLNEYSENQEAESKENNFASVKETKQRSQVYVDAVHTSSQGASCNSECKQESKNAPSNLYVAGFEEPVHTLNLEVNGSIPTSKFSFNPFTYFDKLGESTFKQIALEPPSFHWEAILSHLPILGLTEINFCTILSHRWDIHKKEFLTPEESAYVDELKATYKIT
ncbi:Uncharacterized protein KIAA0825 [Araneus ventricosus]|uniref:Uncharacterized protein KIAA0825 n=1 Tax=Araneus ventricosus TaxID=182803 RepID=A0A4Y2GND7_ARAVE|nr:Uncharacterized protein KIAA0825 [Araneus ventricosus]